MVAGLRYDAGVSPWDQLLGFLSRIIIPDWNALIALVPLFALLGLLGPVLSLLALAWLHHRLTRRAGRVRLGEALPVIAERDEDGQLIVPANAPFCSRDGLIYPGSAATCDRCRGELSVRCPVDDTVRPAAQQLCRACGTRYVLGAADTALTIRRTGRPPRGGAAVA